MEAGGGEAGPFLHYVHIICQVTAVSREWIHPAVSQGASAGRLRYLLRLAIGSIKKGGEDRPWVRGGVEESRLA